MDFLVETYRKTGDLHHAYLIEGDRGKAFAALDDFFASVLGMRTAGNPDLWRAEYESFGIDEGRNLSAMQSMRSAAGGKKIFMIGAGSITVEAQNSLLKVFEEPTAGTHFFLIVPSSERILPTLASRLQIIRAESSDSKSSDAEAEEFLKLSAGGRAEALKPLIAGKDKEESMRFLRSLERALYSRVKIGKAAQGEIFALGEIEKALSYMQDRSPSAKILLEHISLIMPRYR